MGKESKELEFEDLDKLGEKLKGEETTEKISAEEARWYIESGYPVNSPEE